MIWLRLVTAVPCHVQLIKVSPFAIVGPLTDASPERVPKLLIFESTAFLTMILLLSILVLANLLKSVLSASIELGAVKLAVEPGPLAISVWPAQSSRMLSPE